MNKIRAILLTLLIVTSDFSTAAPNHTFIVGVGTHLGQQRLTAAQVKPLMTAAGVNSFRDEVYWGRSEKEKGKLAFHPSLRELDELVTATSIEGGKPIIILDYGNKFYDDDDGIVSTEGIQAFTAYAKFVAQHFKGRVKLFEVWNEWNIGMGSNKKPRTIKDINIYIKLLDSVSKAVKNEIPNAVIIAGAVAGPDDRWIQKFIDAGGISKADAFSVHPYFFEQKNKNRPEDAMDWLQTLNERLSKNNNNKSVPIYLTEVGWPNHHNPNHWTPHQTADFLIRFYLGARSFSYIEGVWWYELVNGGKDPLNKEHNFGLTGIDLKTKPAYQAMAIVSTLVRQSTTLTISTSVKGIYTANITLDKNRCVGLWTKTGTKYQPVESSSPKNATVWGTRTETESGSLEISETPLIMCDKAI